MATLVLLSGPNAPAYYRLKTRVVVVGRAVGCAIQVSDEGVSRRHLQIRPDSDGGYVAADMNSSNGVYVNDNKIEGDYKLNDSDVIRLGTSTLKFLLDDTQIGQDGLPIRHDPQHGRDPTIQG